MDWNSEISSSTIQSHLNLSLFLRLHRRESSIQSCSAPDYHLHNCATFLFTICENDLPVLQEASAVPPDAFCFRGSTKTSPIVPLLSGLSRIGLNSRSASAETQSQDSAMATMIVEPLSASVYCCVCPRGPYALGVPLKNFKMHFHFEKFAW